MNNKMGKKEWQNHNNFVLPSLYSQWLDSNPKIGSDKTFLMKKNGIDPTQQNVIYQPDHLVDIYKAHNESNSERFSANKPSQYIEYNWEITKIDN